MLKQSAEDIFFASIANSKALAYPMALVNRKLSPPSGTNAMLLNTDMIYESLAMILRSHAIANAAPIPAAAPFIEPMTGFGISMIFFKNG